MPGPGALVLGAGETVGNSPAVPPGTDTPGSPGRPVIGCSVIGGSEIGAKVGTGWAGGLEPAAGGAVVTFSEPATASERAALPVAVAVSLTVSPAVAAFPTGMATSSSSAWLAGRLPRLHVAVPVCGQTANDGEPTFLADATAVVTVTSCAAPPVLHTHTTNAAFVPACTCVEPDIDCTCTHSCGCAEVVGDGLGLELPLGLGLGLLLGTGLNPDDDGPGSLDGEEACGDGSDDDGSADGDATGAIDGDTEALALGSVVDGSEVDGSGVDGSALAEAAGLGPASAAVSRT
jgi:hypothetical protein